MDRKQAFQRVQTWLALTGLLEEKPNYRQASNLANFIWNLTDHEEVYTTGFIFDVWRDLRNE